MAGGVLNLAAVLDLKAIAVDEISDWKRDVCNIQMTGNVNMMQRYNVQLKR